MDDGEVNSREGGAPAVGKSGNVHSELSNISSTIASFALSLQPPPRQDSISLIGALLVGGGSLCLVVSLKLVFVSSIWLFDRDQQGACL